MDEQLQAEICARIKQARNEAGMTLEDLADALGVTVRAYWNYEHNRVPFRKLREIAELTGVTQGWLLHGEAPKDEVQQALLRGVAAGVEQLERSAEDVIHRLERIEAALSPDEGSQSEWHRGNPLA